MRVFFNCILLVFYSTTAWAELRDPTLPPSHLSSFSNQFTPVELTAVITKDNQRYAVINGKIAKMGDEVAGNRIIAIDINAVQMEGVNGKVTLFLFGQSVKQPVQKI